MRLPGVCTECRKVKQVQVSGSALVRAQAMRSVPTGICLSCERKKTCKHTRTNERDPHQQTVRCIDCNMWGRRDRRTGELYWT